MEELIYSKHINAVKIGDKYLLKNLLNGNSIKVDEDEFILIENFKNSSCIGSTEYSFKHLRELIDKNFINVSSDDEEGILFKKWVNMFGKEIFSWNVTESLELRYCCRVDEPVSYFPKELAKIAMELGKEFRVFKRPIHICFLSKKEYDFLSAKYSFPEKVAGYVDARTILVINYELFFDSKNSYLFYPTIRHELMHMLLGQYRANIPIWLEEGLCELYSKKNDIDKLNNALRNSDLISFSHISSSDEYSLSDYNIEAVSLETLYTQAVSFTSFLMDSIGQEVFWNIVDKAGIIRSFEKDIVLYTNKTISEFESEWKKNLSNFNEGGAV